MGKVLYRKWRPMTFQEVVGQDHVTETLRNALALGRVGHAYLFAGPRGTGKTTTARLLAKSVNCLADESEERPCNKCNICMAINGGRFLDLIEIDAASNTGVDDVRDLREKIGFMPNEGRFKVYIIDEVHMLSTAAFNALLKTLEEPPPHAIFILATTEAHKIPATVISRCQRFEFRRIPLSLIVDRLRIVLENEGLEAEPAALDLIARQATGSLRDAESLMDQLLSSQCGMVTLAQAQVVLGSATNEVVCQLLDAWIVGNIATGLEIIQRSVEVGTDPKQFSRQIVDYLRAVLFWKTGGGIPSDVPQELVDDIKRQAGELDLAEIIDAIRQFSGTPGEGKGGWQPQLPLELAFVERVQARDGGQDKSPESPTLSPLKATNAVESAKNPFVSKAMLPSIDEAVSEDRKAVAVLPERVEPESGTVTEQRIKQQWNALLTAVKERDFRVEAMLRSGQGVLGVEGETVALGFKYSFHREKMESAEWRQVVEDGFSDVMGCRLRIRCVDPDHYSKPVSSKTEISSPELDTEELKRFAIEELNAHVIENE